jgi:hypothetical protein
MSEANESVAAAPAVAVKKQRKKHKPHKRHKRKSDVDVIGHEARSLTSRAPLKRGRQHDNNDNDASERQKRQRVLLDDNKVQIKVLPEDMKARVADLERDVRDRVDQSNQWEFSSAALKADDFESARTGSRQIERKLQIRLSDVHNEDGPLAATTARARSKRTGSSGSGNDSAKSGPRLATSEASDAVRERLDNLEAFLRLARPMPSDVYERLAAIEHRLLALEVNNPDVLDRLHLAPATSAVATAIDDSDDDSDDDAKSTNGNEALPLETTDVGATPSAAAGSSRDDLDLVEQIARGDFSNVVDTSSIEGIAKHAQRLDATELVVISNAHAKPRQVPVVRATK